MKAIILYDSRDPVGYAGADALSGYPNVDWVAVDVSRETPAPCIGCFGCWVRTPGACVLGRDAGTEYYEAMHGADYVVTLSKITWGGYSTAIKAYTDRLLPLLHPNFRIVHGEMHHRLRYGRMPTFVSAGFGARDRAEEETFRRYVEAQRDQSGLPRGSGCLILSKGTDGSVSTGEIVEWFAKEATA